MSRKIAGFLSLLRPVFADFGVDAKMSEPGNCDLSKDGEPLGNIEFIEDDEDPTFFEIRGWLDSGDEAGWEFYELQDLTVADLYRQNPELDQLVPDGTKDYGAEPVNAFAVLLTAILKLLEQGGTDFENLFEHGGYKMRLRLQTDNGEISTGWWVEATSSENARQSAQEEFGDRLLGATVVGFKSPQQLMADQLDEREPEDYD